MPANLSPEYKAAEAAFRKARDPGERLDHLREMLRVIPKHKGTDHLQADIKRRIKELSEELEGGHRGGGARTGPALVVRPEGAAQIALLGPPNSGKSSLHVALTASHAHIAAYPFTTQYPEPGMMPHEDIHFQLVDLPAVSPEHPVAWLGGALQTADACLLVIDISDADCVGEYEALHEILRARRVTLTEHWPIEPPVADANDDDPFGVRLPTLLVASKSDALRDFQAELDAFRELTQCRYPALAASAETRDGLDAIGAWLFRHLGVIRVYSKTPGHAPDKHRPFTLRRGQCVEDMARLVHKDLARTLKYARVWGHSSFDAQQVGRSHALADGDVVELHT